VTIDLEEIVAIDFHTHAEVGRAGEDGYLTGAGGPGRRGSSTVSPSEREASAPWQKFMTSGRRRRGYRARSRLSSFGSARDKVVCGTSLDPATLDKLKVERPGSRARARSRTRCLPSIAIRLAGARGPRSRAKNRHLNRQSSPRAKDGTGSRRATRARPDLSSQTTNLEALAKAP
jgi:hypothetical protein